MKLKNLILGFFASVAVLVSCEPVEEQLGAPALNLEPETMEFDSKAGEQTLKMTATRDWAVTNDQDWLVFDPESGSGSNNVQEIKVTVLANPGTNRTYEAQFSIGMISKTLTVSQKGDKGEAALDVTKISDFIKAADGSKICTLKGTVSNVAKGDRFWGFDINDGTGTVTAAFPANWDAWKDKIQDGGTVVVKGAYEFYDKKGTHQVKKAEIISFEAGEVVPPTEAEKISIADFIQKADTQKPYRLEGKLENLAKGDRFWGFDINDGTATVTAAFPANWDAWKDKLSEGGTVTVQGPYEFYDKKGTHQVKKCTIISFEAGSVVPPTEAEKISIADFIQKADTQKPYRLEGKLENLAKGDKFWGFDINDGTATVTAAFPANWDAWKDKLSEGGTVTVQGPYEFYDKKGTHQVKKCTIIAFTAGEGGGTTPDPEKPGEIKKVSIKEFLAAPVSDTQWYELTATIDNIASTEYGNMYVKDNTGTLYVYGLTQTKVDKNDKSFSKLGLKVTDVLTFAAKRGEFKGSEQAVGGYYISHKAGEGIEEKPDGPATEPFTSKISWTVSKDSKNDPLPSYKDNATINGAQDKTPVLKLGSSSKYGKATLTIPAGTKKIGFYACAWKGTSAKLKFSNGVEVSGIRANVGATQNGPFTLKDVTALDYFVIEMNGETELTIETFGMGKRAIIFGVNPVK